jgi:hypothetical protein
LLAAVAALISLQLLMNLLSSWPASDKKDKQWVKHNKIQMHPTKGHHAHNIQLHNTLTAIVVILLMQL